MKFRVICARTREPLGEFEAANYDDAAEKGKVYENGTRHTIVYPLPEEARPIQEVQAHMPITEGDRTLIGIDLAVPGSDETGIVFSFKDIETRVEGWLNANLLLPGGYRLVPHVHRGPRENLVGRWEVSFVLVAPADEKHVPGNGSPPKVPEGTSGKDAG